MLPSSNRKGKGLAGSRNRRAKNSHAQLMAANGRKVQRVRRAKVQRNTAPSRKKPILRERAAAAGRSMNKTRKGTKPVKDAAKGASSSGKQGSKLSQLLTPKNLRQSVKTVGSLRSMVKTGLGYLQQADQLLESLYATSTSLKESGVLDKIVKQRGRNLSTEDFTNILMALMSSPIGGQIFKSRDSGSSDAQTASTGEE